MAPGKDLSDLALQPSTLSVHASDHLNPVSDAAPAIHVATTFRYSSPLVPVSDLPKDYLFSSSPEDMHVYSRLATPNSTALESTLSALLGGHAIAYSSGLSAFHALLVRTNPKRLILMDCYHGVQGLAGLFSQLTGMTVHELGSTPPQRGDLVHIETPLNPYGTAVSIGDYARQAHAAGAQLSVDSTFAPPPLQAPFALGADWVLHSASKYLGGHSDLLGGVLVTRDADHAGRLKEERTLLGCVMGNLEAWLEMRSLRTLELRVVRQARTACALAGWLEAERAAGRWAGVLREVHHASLQKDGWEEGGWLKTQMPNGGGGVFAIVLEKEEMASRLPAALRLLLHATSLGGVESLIEWRAMSDATCDRRLLRVSVGIEDLEDLKKDLERGLESVQGL